METLYTLYDKNVAMVTNVSLAICRAMHAFAPDTITYRPTEKPLFKYEICFSTPLMNRTSAHDIITRCVNPEIFPAYTVFDGEGSWHGKPESSYTWTVTQDENDVVIDQIAKVFKDVFCQESVLVIKTAVDAKFI